MKRKIYVASSWRNELQPEVVKALRNENHQVYDFRNPSPENYGFHWSHVDIEYKDWDWEQYRILLNDPICIDGFKLDYNAMKWADTCVLVLPSGRSAHLEAGYFCRPDKQLYILLGGKVEPELMYLMATSLATSIDDLIYRMNATYNIGPIS